MRTAITLFVLLLVSAAVAAAVSAGIAMETKTISADSVQIVSTGVANGVNKDHMLLWKRYANPYTGYQAVVELMNVRYTIYVSNRTGLPDSTGYDFISIWSRPIGADSTRKVWTWTDNDMDGTVDWAHDGDSAMDFNKDQIPQEIRDMFQFAHYRAITQLVGFFQKE